MKVDFKYDRTCLALLLTQYASGLPAVIAARSVQSPERAGTFNDAVLAEITVESETIEDFVLLRSDGSPTYHLGVVVDESTCASAM